MMLAAAGTVAILAGSMALAGSASAAPLPSCATGVRCTNNSGDVFTHTFSHGVAGYYGADDNHTRYRFVQTIVTASPSLINLNGFAGKTPTHEGGVGVTLCDPNTGQAAQVSLGYNGTAYVLRWTVGYFFPGNTNTNNSFAVDPCVQVGFAFPQNFHSFGTIAGITQGDQIYMGIYYDPSGTFFHQISFGVCDITLGVCRQAWSGTRFQANFSEFGIGAFSGHNFIQGGANNLVGSFTSNDVTCYSCSKSVPITSVQPVNPFGVGGLYEAQFVNTSSQVQLSPNDSLTPTSFKMWSGSTGGI